MLIQLSVQRSQLLILAVASAAAALKLPSYVTPCQRSSADFQQCALASARTALQHIIQGDRKLRTPSLSPMRVTSLEIETPGAFQLKLKLTDIEILGLAQTQLKQLNVDLERGKMEYVCWTPQWNMTSNYNISGQIILLPITGEGNSNIRLENVFWWTMVSFDKERLPNKPEHLRVTDVKVVSNHTRGSLHLDNLFNGEKLLGDQMNRLMNENWSELNAIVSPFLEQASADVYKQVFHGLFSKVTFEDIFPE